MKIQYFKDCANMAEVKIRYRELVKEFHPDLHDESEYSFYNARMAEINAEYDHIATYGMKFTAHKENAAESTTEHAADNVNDLEKFKDIINKIIFCDGVIIDIIGTWVWLEGNTYAHKDTIKAAGFKWAGKKKAWYWHSEEDTARRHSKMTLDEIKELHGCTQFSARGKIAIA